MSATTELHNAATVGEDILGAAIDRSTLKILSTFSNVKPDEG